MGNYAGKLITFDGLTLNINDWAKRVGIHPSTLSIRLKRWPIKKALGTPKIPNEQKRPPSGLKHGMHRSPIYQCWQGMLNRCRSRGNKLWPSYGGRGITVCDRWLKFENFYADMGDRPPGLWLDRIDNDGNYEPNNCRWTSRHEQQKNKRQTIHIEHDGRKQCITDWARELGMNPKTLMCRFHLGQRPPELFRQPKKTGRPRICQT